MAGVLMAAALALPLMLAILYVRGLWILTDLVLGLAK